jgi:hypothetical protein
MTMPTTLYRYQPALIPGPQGTDPRPTGPSGADGPDTLTELCELDGWRYVAVPEGVTPSVPAALGTWETVALTPELREAIKAASPHTQLIAERVIGRIRERYPLDEEMYFARIAVGALQGTYTILEGEAEALTQYQADVEAAREWGRMARAELGL